MTNDLNQKAVDIKGKKYVLVVDRIAYFNETYPKGSITTQLLSKPEDTTIVVKATVMPDVEAMRTFNGHSQAVIGQGMVNKTAALENAETSAVGRALAMMGIGIIESVASADEMAKSMEPESREYENAFDTMMKTDEPFPSVPANDLCKTCDSKMVPGKNGLMKQLFIE